MNFFCYARVIMAGVIHDDNDAIMSIQAVKRRAGRVD